MATISTSGIESGRIIRSAHVLRIIEALDGEANNDIIISGSLITTGSVGITGSLDIVGNVTGSEFTGSFTGDGSNLTGVTGEWDGTHDGNADITGSFNVSGSTGLTGSLDVSGSVVLSGSFSGSYEGDGSALTGLPATNSGSFSGSFEGDGSALTGITGEWDGTRDGNAEITGSLIVTDGLTLNNGTSSFTGQFHTTGSKVTFGKHAGTSPSYAIQHGGYNRVTNTIQDSSGLGDNFAQLLGVGRSGGIGGVDVTNKFQIEIEDADQRVDPHCIASIYSSASGDNQPFNNDKVFVAADRDMSFVSGSKIEMYRNTSITGSLGVSQSVTANSFIGDGSALTGITSVNSGSFSGSFEGDGSALTGVTSEWDGTRDGNAEITGSFNVSGSIGITGSLIVSSSATIDGTVKISTSGSSSNVLIGNNIGGVLLNNHNTIIGGDNCGFNTRGGFNTILGTDAGLNLLTGNVAIGNGALGNSINGAFNIGIGRDAGRNSNADGIDNVYIGYRVGPTTASVEDAQLYIGNSNYHTDDDTLIRGDFDNQTLEFNADTTISGSLGITEVLSLAPIDPLPTNKPTGSFATSGSAGSVKPFFWDGTNWNALY